MADLYRQAERYHGYTLAGWRHRIVRRTGKPHLFVEDGEKVEMTLSECGDVWVSSRGFFEAERCA